jgi:hypothetical protein
VCKLIRVGIWNDSLKIGIKPINGRVCYGSIIRKVTITRCEKTTNTYKAVDINSFGYNIKSIGRTNESNERFLDG